MKRGNLYTEIPGELPEEWSEVLAEGHGEVRVDRLVSRGHASPPDFWYDQDTTEWVVLLQGSATLRFEEEEKPREMMPGDWIEIGPHTRHRVEATAEEEDTIWLAVHWGPDGAGSRS